MTVAPLMELKRLPNDNCCFHVSLLSSLLSPLTPAPAPASAPAPARLHLHPNRSSGDVSLTLVRKEDCSLAYYAEARKSPILVAGMTVID